MIEERKRKWIKNRRKESDTMKNTRNYKKYKEKEEEYKKRE